MLITSIGAGLAALTVTAALGLTDIWRRRPVVYFPLLLLLIAAAGMLTFGSHFGGEGIYLEGIAVRLKGGVSSGIEYWAPAQSMHVVLAGFAAAATLGALGMSIRVLLGTRAIEDEAVTDKELELLHEPDAAVVPPAAEVPTAVTVPAGANDLTMVRPPSTPTPPCRCRGFRRALLATGNPFVPHDPRLWRLATGLAGRQRLSDQ